MSSLQKTPESFHGYFETPLGMLCEINASNTTEKPLIFYLCVEHDPLAVRGKQPVFRSNDFKKP